MKNSRVVLESIAAVLLWGLASSAAKAESYVADNVYGFARVENPLPNGASIRIGSTVTYQLSIGSKAGQRIDVGTGFVHPADQVVSAPSWLTYGFTGTGTFGPDACTIRFMERGQRTLYLHATFYPSYAEANAGFFTVNVQGPYAAFTTLPAVISQGATVIITASGGDDGAALSSMTLQSSVNGGAWSTLATGGRGNGSASSVTGSFVAGAAGTTYRFRVWSTDTNTYSSKVVESNSYTVEAPPVVTGYQVPDGTDIGMLFRRHTGGAKVAATGLQCTINGTVYDLSDLLMPRVSAARPAVGLRASTGTDLSQLFETR